MEIRLSIRSAMKRMILILVLSEIACGQFLRFDDSHSVEDDSREGFFRTRTRTNTNRATNFRNRDSPEDFFRGNRGRDSLDISDNFFGSRGRDRNRIDVSDEDRFGFFGTNRNSFVPRRPTTSFRSNNNNRFRTRNNVNNRVRFDSVEDLFEDLFDDDLDDRIRAQNALSGLRNGGTNRLGNSGSTRNTGFPNFRTRLGSNRFTPTTRTNTGTFQTQVNNRNAIRHFSIPHHQNRNSGSSVNRFGNSGFSFGTSLRNSNKRLNTNRNQFGSSANRGVPLSQTFSRNTNRNQFGSSANRGVPLAQTFSRNTNRNQFSSSANRGVPLSQTFTSNTNNNNRRTQSNQFTSFNTGNRGSPSPINSIRSSAKRPNGFTSPPGFNWPGGNGYYVRMSTGNSKPFSYFVKYDD